MSPSDRCAEVWAQVLELTERLLRAAGDDDAGLLGELVTERGALIDELSSHGAAVALEAAQAARLCQADQLVGEVLGKMLAAAREELGLLRVWQNGLHSYAGGPIQARFLDRRG
ncbi:MAG: hypothetical protein Q8P31_08440 [Bacillota bacterium]|nr:hypothetical protein [Bacillota bacterium]